jgi:hypothetical protein
LAEKTIKDMESLNLFYQTIKQRDKKSWSFYRFLNL